MTTLTAKALVFAMGLACLPATGLALTPAPAAPVTPATAAAPATPATPSWTDAEVAYFAAKRLQLDFENADAICRERRWRKPLAAGRTAFEQAHPEYVAALAYVPAGAFAPLAERELASTAEAHAMLRSLLAMAPAELRAESCDEVVAGRAGTDFAAKLADAREALANAAAVAIATAPLGPVTDLAADDVNAIAAAILRHPEVAMYLHPDAPGRVPVKVGIDAPYDAVPLAFTLYDAPVKTVAYADMDAVRLTMRGYGETAKASVRYAPEGIEGSVELARVDGAWTVTGAHIFE
jgi:hypothetical protein